MSRMKIGPSKGGGWWIFPVSGWGKDNLYPKYVYYQLKLIIKFFTLFHHYELEVLNVKTMLMVKVMA